MARKSHASSPMLLFSPNTTLGWRVTRRICAESGERHVAMRRMRRVFDEVGQHIGYQLLQEESLTRRPVSGSNDPCAIITREVQAIAGEFGDSRTERLAELDRRGRVHPKSGRLMAEEDFIERARAKVAHWPVPANYHGDRAIRVYPRQLANA